MQRLRQLSRKQMIALLAILAMCCCLPLTAVMTSDAPTETAPDEPGIASPTSTPAPTNTARPTNTAAASPTPAPTHTATPSPTLRPTITNSPMPPTNTPQPVTNTPPPATNAPLPVATNTVVAPVAPSPTLAPPAATLPPAPTAEPTATPLPTEPPAPAPSQVVIIGVNKREEYVDIQNTGGTAQDLAGWRLVSETGNQSCTLGGVIEPGQVLRIWAQAEDAGQGGYNCGFGGPIWNNDDPDPAVLYDANGNEVSRR